MDRFKLLISAVFVLFILESAAHTIVLSSYKLKNENDGWTLHFQQKTRALRDAIYAERSDLKGVDLNSDVFLNATSSFITEHVMLQHKGTLLRLTPKLMKYDGLSFKGQFTVEGLEKDPDYLSIATSGFDTHEHSMKIFSISIGKESYLYNFRLDQKQALFSFGSKRYLLGDAEPSNDNQSWPYLAGLFAVLIIFAGTLNRFGPRAILRVD